MRMSIFNYDRNSFEAIFSHLDIAKSLLCERKTHGNPETQVKLKI